MSTQTNKAMSAPQSNDSELDEILKEVMDFDSYRAYVKPLTEALEAYCRKREAAALEEIKANSVRTVTTDYIDWRLAKLREGAGT